MHVAMLGRCGGWNVNCMCVQVPYSEHSSFTEMHDFVSWIRPRRVIPSVNNDGGRKTRQMLHLLGY